MKLLAALAVLAAWTGQALASDNYLAHQLFQEGRHAEAAEIFTDPAWKGVALYRSDQWWRAAEAFVRASDPDSLYNLGNTYARLSYFALALESYQAALVLRPDFPDARHNADIMREMLRRQDEEKKGQAAMTPKQKAIDRVEDNRKEDGGADPQAGDEKGKAEKRQDGQKQEGGKDSRQPAPKAQAQGDSGSAGDGKERQDKEGDGGTSLTGKRGDRDPASRPSGGSQSADATDRSDAAGARAALESGQATEQWLNAIPDDPARFLKRRIALELNRRKAAGNAPDEGQSPW